MSGAEQMARRLETAFSGDDVAAEAQNGADLLHAIAKAWGEYQRAGVGARYASSAELARLIEGTA